MEKKNQGTPAKGSKSGNSNKRSNDREIKKPNQGSGSNPDDFGDDPEKKKEIGDDPDGTQRKIPRM